MRIFHDAARVQEGEPMSHGGLAHSGSAGQPSVHASEDLLEQVAHKIGLAVTLGYVLVSCVGVVFETLLLRSFQADFLTYAEPEDFLMAGLRHPVVLGFVLLSVLVLFMMLGAVRFGTRLSARYAAWRSHTGRFTAIRIIRQALPVIAVGYYFFLFTQIYARHEAQAIRAGEEPHVRLEFQQYGAVSGASNLNGRPDGYLDGYLVATTGRYVFLYEPRTQKMRVIPVSAVRQLLSRDRGPARTERTKGLAGNFPTMERPSGGQRKPG